MLLPENSDYVSFMASSTTSVLEKSKIATVIEFPIYVFSLLSFSNQIIIMLSEPILLGSKDTQGTEV